MSIDETSDGAAYLSALKRSGSPQAAGTATARAPVAAHSEAQAGEVVPASRASPAGQNKRKTQRYKCKGSARLQESGSAVATWATFVDISLNGCYVEAASPLRVATVLGLRLELNGLRVEATGEVRVAYPNLGMGIRFITMSEDNRKRLRELIETLPQSSVSPAPQAATRDLSIPQPDALAGVASPSAALRAILAFFENRHVMGREEFLRILRKSQ
jgi:hypothetical protein